MTRGRGRACEGRAPLGPAPPPGPPRRVRPPAAPAGVAPPPPPRRLGPPSGPRARPLGLPGPRRPAPALVRAQGTRPTVAPARALEPPRPRPVRPRVPARPAGESRPRPPPRWRPSPRDHPRARLRRHGDGRRWTERARRDPRRRSRPHLCTLDRRRQAFPRVPRETLNRRAPHVPRGTSGKENAEQSRARISPALDAARCVLVLALGLRLGLRPAALRATPNGSAIYALHLLSALQNSGRLCAWRRGNRSGQAASCCKAMIEPRRPTGRRPSSARGGAGHTRASGGSLTRRRPPMTRNGAAHSAVRPGAPNPRAVTRLRPARWASSRPSVSARPFQTSTRGDRPRRWQAPTRKRARRPLASTRAHRLTVQARARARAGTPPPLPRSSAAAGGGPSHAARNPWRGRGGIRRARPEAPNSRASSRTARSLPEACPSPLSPGRRA